MYEFRPYLISGNPKPENIIDNLKVYLNGVMHEEFNLEIVEVQDNPQLVQTKDDLETPTVIKLSPPPVQKAIGDLGDKISVKSDMQNGTTFTLSFPAKDVAS